MGIYLSVYLDARNIGDAAWATAWDDVVALFEAWPSGLLGFGKRTIEGTAMPMYTRSIRFEDKTSRWCCVIGDRTSLRTGEDQTIRRDLGVDVRTPSDVGQVRDILCVAAGRGREGAESLRRVFGNKTQGLPFHVALVAAGMLLEERFPRSAYTSGDIDRDDAEVAARLAAPVLGRTLAAPVCTDAARLITRLRAEYADDALDAAAARLFRGEPIDLLEGHVRARPEAEAAAWFVRALRRATRGEGAAGDAPGAAALLVAWLNAGRGLADAARLMCHDPRGPQSAPSDFVDALAASLLALPLTERGAGAPSATGDATGADRMTAVSNWLLSRALPGHRLRVLEPVERVDEALHAAFGEAAGALGARFREKCDEERRSLQKIAGTSAALGRRFGLGRLDAFEALATLPSLDAMDDPCRSAVECLAWNVRRAQEELRSRKAKAALEVPALRRLLVGLKYNRSPTLTEAAWDHFLALEDPVELSWLVGLASLDASAMPLCVVRRALFENHALRRWAMAAGVDAARMEQVGAEIRQASTDRERARR